MWRHFRHPENPTGLTVVWWFGCLVVLLLSCWAAWLLSLQRQPQGAKRKLTGSIFVTSAQVSRSNVQPNGKCVGAQGYQDIAKG